MRTITVAILLVCVNAFSIGNCTAQQIDLQKLSDQQLIDHYVQAGLALRGTSDVPTDEPVGISAMGPDRVRTATLDKAREELVRRGSPIVPALLRFLQTEAMTHRAADSQGNVACFIGDTLNILRAIGDPSAISVAMQILDGNNGEVVHGSRRAALQTIQAMTFCAMHRVVPFENRDSRNAVQHPTAIAADRFNDLGAAVILYRQWLAGEGKDPAQWLPLARQRARRLLDQSTDPDTMFCAADFLLARPGRDDNPDATARRLAEVIDRFVPGEKPYKYSYPGAASPIAPMGNWVDLLSKMGKPARPYAKSLIRIQTLNGENSWSDFACLRKVSGTEIVNHLIEALPRISVEVEKINADPNTPKGFSGDDPRLAWIQSQREVELTIDRWAGRRFDNTADRIAWWNSNKNGDREQLMKQNLQTLVKQADAGDIWADGLASEILPDLRNFGLAAMSQNRGSFRAQWLQDHISNLEYDPQTEAFRLVK